MQVSSLLLLQDRSMGPLDLSGISDQAIMETLIDGLNTTSKQQFKTIDGQYKDVCKWNGILCNGRRQVKEIMWDSTTQPQPSFTGSFSFANFPPFTKIIRIRTRESENEFFDIVFVYSDTSALPRGLTCFSIENVWIKSLDLRRLPSSLIELQAKSCGVSGSCSLTPLPRKLQTLLLSDNFLQGSISLDRLPSNLFQMDLSINDLSGSINLRSLPSGLTWLSLRRNQLSGSVEANYLPQGMYVLQLDENELSGTFVFTSPPEKLKVIDIRNNNFAAPAFVSRESFPLVEADWAAMGGGFDENGLMYTESDIAKGKVTREMGYRSFLDNKKSFADAKIKMLAEKHFSIS